MSRSQVSLKLLLIFVLYKPNVRKVETCWFWAFFVIRKLNRSFCFSRICDGCSSLFVESVMVCKISGKLRSLLYFFFSNYFLCWFKFLKLVDWWWYWKTEVTLRLVFGIKFVSWSSASSWFLFSFMVTLRVNFMRRFCRKNLRVENLRVEILRVDNLCVKLVFLRNPCLLRKTYA